MYTEQQIAEWKLKAEKWDKLDEKISTFYYDEEFDATGEEDTGGLISIGEAAAHAFGYL